MSSLLGLSGCRVKGRRGTRRSNEEKGNEMEGVHGSRRYVWYRTRLIELLGKALVPPQYMFIIRTSVDTPRDTSIDVNMSCNL